MYWLPLSVRNALSASVALIAVTLTLACERKTPPAARNDTATPVTPPPESTVVVKPEESTWDTTSGPALFVAGSTPQEALVIAPRYTDTTQFDSTRFDPAVLRSLQVDLFGGGNRVGTARIGSTVGSSRSDSCRAWPTARLDISPADTASARSWIVAFEAGHASPLSVDSIEGLPGADSAQLAADIARLASALPGDTSAIFRGLPFVVKKAWRTRIPTGQLLLTAVVVRNVNQEANPRQERIFLIAERDSGATTGRFTTRYSERISGLEETVETTDVITIVLLGAERRPTIVVTRDAGNGLSYTLIQRLAGRWQQRWASTYAGC